MAMGCTGMEWWGISHDREHFISDVLPICKACHTPYHTMTWIAPHYLHIHKEVRRSLLHLYPYDPVLLYKAVLEYYDTRYPHLNPATNATDYFPTQMIESYWCGSGQPSDWWPSSRSDCVVNALADIAGLNFTLTRLLRLPASLTGNDERPRWERMARHLPLVPTTAITTPSNDTVSVLAPGANVQLDRRGGMRRHNHENAGSDAEILCCSAVMIMCRRAIRCLAVPPLWHRQGQH